MTTSRTSRTQPTTVYSNDLLEGETINFDEKISWEDEMVHVNEQADAGTDDEEQDTTTYDVVTGNKSAAELRSIQFESESIEAAERLFQEHASKHVPRLGMTFNS